MVLVPYFKEFHMNLLFKNARKLIIERISQTAID